MGFLQADTQHRAINAILLNTDRGLRQAEAVRVESDKVDVSLT